MKTLTVNISDEAYLSLKAAAEHDGTSVAAFARPALERAAYAAELAAIGPDGAVGYLGAREVATYQDEMDEPTYGETGR